MNRVCPASTRLVPRLFGKTPTPVHFAKQVAQADVIPRTYRSPSIDVFNIEPLRMNLPTVEGIRIISLPSTSLLAKMTPPTEATIERVDPATSVEFNLPSYITPSPVLASPRLLTIRRKKMKKHKRKKRYDRDWSKYQKYHREKKLKAEKEYERRMAGHLAELKAFDPEKYVEDTIAASKKVWEKEVAPTGRKLYPHWSRLISIEELYGVVKSDFIDKKSAIPGEEDAAKIQQLKQKYKSEFKGQN